MTRACKTCEPCTLVDPRRLLEELGRRGLLVPGPDLVVVLDNVPEETVLGVEPLPPDWAEDDPCFVDAMAPAILRAGGQKRGSERPAKTVVLVRRRRGRAVDLPHEMNGWLAWLNEHQETDCYAGEWLLVTEHGWRNLVRRAGGAMPALATRLLRLA